MLKKSIKTLLILLPPLLIAPPLSAGSGWTDYAPVTELTPTGQMRYTVKLDVDKNPSGCKNSNIFYQDYDAVGADKMFRVLLEAVAAGKQVRLFVTGGCELNGYAEISSLSIIP